MISTPATEPTQKQLHDALTYDPLSGEVRWKTGVSNMMAGELAGAKHPSGYIVITFNSRTYKLHRLIWILLFGQIPDGFYLDHINGNRTDNRLQNLRLATNAQNQQNRPAPKNNSSGYRGVCWHKQMQKWWARYTHNGVRYSVGMFDTPEAAYAAYKAAIKKVYTHTDRLP